MFLVLAVALPVLAFGPEGAGVGCGASKCSDCHSLSVQEAATLLKGFDKILKVDFAELPGLWVVDAEKDGQKFPVYIDFSKEYVVAGNVIKLATGENLTQNRLLALNNGKVPGAAAAAPQKADMSRIALSDSILLGKADAKTKVVVFTDPECPYCKKLHAELKDVVKADPSIAFYIKLFPLVKLHPNAYGLAKAIVCSPNPLSLLEAGFNGAPVAPSACPTTKIDENMTLAGELGIVSTPTLVLPDGTIAPGYKKAAELLKLFGSKATLPKGS